MWAQPYPQGATHSGFAGGKEYKGAADPEKACCHLNEDEGILLLAGLVT